MLLLLLASLMINAETGGFSGGERITEYTLLEEPSPNDQLELKWTIINNECVQRETTGNLLEFYNSESECNSVRSINRAPLEEPTVTPNYQDYPYVYYEIKWDDNTIKRCVENYAEFEQDVAEYNFQNMKYYIYSLSDCYKDNGGRAFYKTYDNCEEYYSFYDLNSEMIDLGNTQIPKFDWNKISCPNHKQQLDATQITKDLVKYQSPMEGVKELEVAEEGDYLFYQHGEAKNCLENKYEDTAHNFYILRKNRDQTSNEKYYSSRDACFYLNGGNIIYGSSCAKIYTFDVKEDSMLSKAECEALPAQQSKLYAEKPTSQSIDLEIKEEANESREEKAQITTQSELENKNEVKNQQVETTKEESDSRLFDYLPGETQNEQFMWFAGIAILLYLVLIRN